MDQKLIRKIGKSIQRQNSNTKVYLLRSGAKGDFKPDFDMEIRILVDNQKITNEIEEMFRDELYTIEMESGIAISTFIYS